MKFVWLKAVSVPFEGVDQIVEIAAVITSSDITELGTTNWTVTPPKNWVSKIDPAQVQRLKRSGLYRIMQSGVSMRSAEESIMEVIRLYVAKPDIVFAGADLDATWKLLDQDMPNLARWLSGPRFPIEMIRHLFTLGDRSDVVEAAESRDRALDDVYEIVDEMRGYVTAVGCIP
jgi:oligoribonuclease (3'-5' exoribonuclease)